MPTGVECVCCREVDEVVRKIEENDTEVDCITSHEGFQAVCLNRWVLQAAYFAYRERYGSDSEDRPIHE